jgi:hypothetical protein
MSAIGLILGGIAAVLIGRSTFETKAMTWIVSIAGTVTLGLGIAALWAETSELLLGAFIIGIVVVWAIEMVFHYRALLIRRRRHASPVIRKLALGSQTRAGTCIGVRNASRRDASWHRRARASGR